MPEPQLHAVLHHLRRAAGAADGACVADPQLLERFVHKRDGTAFELLVWRHQRMVFDVCRRTLNNVHDAEDAFQATFLVLVRKAQAVSQGASLASWLYKVAYRCALPFGAEGTPVRV